MTKKILAIFSTVTLLASSALPVLADSTITGNGTGSDNTITTTVTQATTVSQTNNAAVTNTVNSSSNSGNNSTSYNTGGSTSVSTGNASTNVTVANTANSNVANVSNCNCGTGDTNVAVTDNGANTHNTADTTSLNQTEVDQTNTSDVNNNVKADSNSGKNNASYNTGGGVSVTTGDATTNVGLTTTANQNIAQVGDPTANGGNGSADSVIITGNGTGSHNNVDLGLTDYVTLGQVNSAAVNNSVDAKSNTGKNTANDNTGGNWLGGDVTIQTGNATTGVSADTAVNFNDATIGCDCLVGLTAKVGGNGAGQGEYGTTNTIDAALTNVQAVGQGNGGDGINNGLNGNSSSGDNGSKLNTGATTDPSIMTGDSSSTTGVTNQGNANVYGTSDVNPFPWNWSNSNVSVTFSLQDLLAALGIN